jgi:hypothetical protein
MTTKKMVMIVRDMLIRLRELRVLIKEEMSGDWRSILRPAIEKLVKMVQDNPLILSSQEAIDVLQGKFGDLSPGDVLNDQDVEKELIRFEKIAKRVGYPPIELAGNWADSIDTWLIPSLQEILKSQTNRNADAPVEGETWGKYLFAPARTDVPLEPDTADEKRAFKAIHAMLFNNVPLPSKVALQLQQLVATKQYVAFLEPTSKTFYRGMFGLTTEQVTSLLGHPPSKTAGTEKVTTIFKPKRVGSSWSIKKSAASGYSLDKKTGTDLWSVVLTATKVDNANVFILNPARLYDLEGFAGDDNQDNASSEEVYAVGKVKLSIVSYKKQA